MEQLALPLRQKPCNTCEANKLSICKGCTNTQCAYCQGICHCKTCHVICPNHENKIQYLNDISTYTLQNNTANNPIQLPQFIPMITKEKIDLTKNSEELKMVAVSTKDLIRNGRVSPKAQTEGIHEFYHLPKKTKIILALTGKEYILERLWRDHYKHDLFKELKELGLHAATSTNLTVAEEHPRYMHIHNIRRNNITYDSLIKAGIPAIPDISWFNKDDLTRWIKWLKKEQLNCISITTQCMKTRHRELLNPLLNELETLINEVNQNTNILFIGPSYMKTISHLQSRFNNVSIISTLPFRKAMSGCKAYMENKEIKYSKNKTRSKEKLFTENIQTYNQAITRNNYHIRKSREHTMT